MASDMLRKPTVEMVGATHISRTNVGLLAADMDISGSSKCRELMMKER